MFKTATYALALVAVVAATMGASALIASYVDLPDWLRIGSWHWPVLAGAVLLLSRWRFGTIMPGVLGGVAGTVFLAVLGCMISDIWVRGLIAPLLAAYPAMLMLQACEQAVALRRGQQVTPGWLNPLITASVLIFLFICLGLSATGDNREMSVWHEVVASSGAAAVLTVLFMLPGHSALRSTVWLARLLFPAPGRWPADGATVLNSLCGYGTFALSCLTLPLFMPLAWILPGGRQRWVATAMRRAMRLTFWMTPTVTWRMAGDVSALDGARVVVANHEGMLDILVACALPGTRTLLAKTWVFRAFPLGVAARAAGLKNSDLLAPDDYLEGEETSPVLEPGLGLFVFPEGKRSRSGAIDRFRPGAFVLAKSLDAPVVPVAIAGSRQGIRPGSMWIHPTRLISHVLPPMRPEADESMRQFAARVRTAIATQRLAMMRELVLHPRFTRSHRHFFTGLSPALRRAAHADHRSGPWRLLTATVRDVPGAWVMLGCGWSAVPVALRQLLPAMPILAVEPDDQRRGAARHAWLNPGDDALVATFDELVGDGPLAGIACLLDDDAAAMGMAARLAPRCREGVVLVRRAASEPWRVALAGQGEVRELAGDAEWVVLAAG